jgi:hypothetical protein
MIDVLAAPDQPVEPVASAQMGGLPEATSPRVQLFAHSLLHLFHEAGQVS